jgi:glucose-1-phosphate adenylyltransferase
MSVEENGRVTALTEKPKEPEPMPGNPDQALVSMGIYVFNREYLFGILREDAENFSSSRDFGRDVLPVAIARHRVHAYSFSDPVTGKQAYWRDVGTVDSFYRANQELIYEEPELDLHDDEWPIWTYQAQLPPAKFIHDQDGKRGIAIDSIISGGNVIAGAEVRRSVLFSQVVVRAGAYIESSLVLPHVKIDAGARIQGAIIDEGCRIPAGMVIGEDLEQDKERFHVSPGGVVLVTAEMLGQEVAHVR